MYFLFSILAILITIIIIIIIIIIIWNLSIPQIEKGF